jgi:ribosomal protein L11 methyltransferase
VNKLKQIYWLELIIESNRDELDVLSALFQDNSMGSVFNEKTLSIFFLNSMKNSIENKLIYYNEKYQFEWTWNIIKDEDWHLNWKDNFIPVRIGNRITIIPSWDVNTSSEILIRIEPGRAFGTGHHQTTFLAIEMLEEFIVNSSRVLDFGAGSGILSIASWFLGATKIDAVEIDSECIENFNTNIELNNMKDEINFFHLDVLEWKNFNYDIIVANINRNIILKLIPNFKGIKSKIILTGLLVEDEVLIKGECIKNNMIINQVIKKDEWIAMEVESA